MKALKRAFRLAAELFDLLGKIFLRNFLYPDLQDWISQILLVTGGSEDRLPPILSMT